MKSPSKPHSEEGNKGSAGSKAQKGNANDHIGKVRPAGDGKDSHKENLVGENREGNKKQGKKDVHSLI